MLAIQNAALADFYSPALLQDDAFMAISAAITPQLQSFVNQISKAIIFSNLPNQPEEVLDFIALYHFNVDSYAATLPYEQKLLLVQNVLLDKLSKGTPLRIKSIIANANLRYAELVEWWQTTPKGAPYTFSIVIADPNPSQAAINAMTKNILQMKNVRSYFGGITTFNTPTGSGSSVYVSVSTGNIDYVVVGTSGGLP